MDVIKLVEQRNKLTHDMRELHQLAENEDRALTAEEREKWDAMGADVEAFDQRIDTAKRASELREVEVPTDAPAELSIGGEAQRKAIEGSDVRVPTYDDAFGAYLRGGLMEMTPEHRALMLEHRAQATAPDSAGGYGVPTDLYNQIIETMMQYGGLANVCNILNTSAGNPLEFATNDDTGNAGTLLAENTGASDVDTVFGQKVMTAYKFTSGMVKVSRELLQDEAVNLTSYLANILGKRLGRGESGYFCTGSGTGEPEGIVTGATIEATAAALDGISYQDLLDLEHAVDPAYRAGGVGTFVFNDATLKAIKGLLDQDGRPLWLPAIAGSAPATILGYPYQIDQGMADIGASASSAVFGDMSAFTIRRVMSVELLRLEERYAEAFQHGFIGFTRCDSKLLDTAAVAKLTHPAV